MKNGHVHEDRNVGKSNDTPTKLFSVDTYDLKSISILVMLFSLVLKYQGKTTRGPFGK